MFIEGGLHKIRGYKRGSAEDHTLPHFQLGSIDTDKYNFYIDEGCPHATTIAWLETLTCRELLLN